MCEVEHTNSFDLAVKAHGVHICRIGFEGRLFFVSHLLLSDCTAFFEDWFSSPASLNVHLATHPSLLVHPTSILYTDNCGQVAYLPLQVFVLLVLTFIGIVVLVLFLFLVHILGHIALIRRVFSPTKCLIHLSIA